MPRSAVVLHRHIERQKPVEQRALAPGDLEYLLRSPDLYQPEPAQRPQDPPRKHHRRPIQRQFRHRLIRPRAQRGERVGCEFLFCRIEQH